MDNSKRIKFGDVLYIKGRIGWQRLQKSEYLTQGNYYLITGIDITNDHKVDFSKCYYVSKERYELDDKIQVHNGDIIVTKDGTIGKIALIENKDKPGTLNSHLFLIRNLKPEILNTNYLFYILRSDLFQRFALYNTIGSNIPAFTQASISNFEINIPSLEIQKSAADLLTKIDKKISLNIKTNTELENMAKTIYDYWFTQFDFPDKNGHPYKTSGGQVVYNEILKREIPAGWEVGKLSDIANITMGQSPDGESYNEDGNGTIFYQGSTDFGNRSPSIRVYTTAPTRFAKKNDILMSVRAPVGTLNIANTDCCIGRGLAALNSKSNSISYLYCVMRNFQRQFEVLDSIGTTFGSITKDDLFGLQVIIPPQDIIENFCKIGNEIFKEQSRIDEENTELTKLRDYLLPLLMNGQITVN